MRRTTIAALALAVLLPLPSFAGTVTVKSGDTLSDIADRYGISVGALMRMNGLRDANHVEVGQTLQVPGPRVVAGSGRHTVRSGDTLSGIADRYRVSEKALIALNNLPSADHVELGATLKLPSNAVLPKPKPKQAPKPKPVAIKANPNATAHTVASGQTLTQIAKAYDVPVATLIQLNDLTDPNKVTVGTKLMLRGTTPKPNPSKQTVEATQPAPKAQPAPKSQTAKAVETARPLSSSSQTVLLE
ncbi:MAG: LysM peptidoglycan-binding domain-containing protein [Synechococcaceae bacterium WB9_4xB_025]|nr:LysM peptidoglycan-binding domain-containing protein [Synechococcaceae bacterium WB9_4xB_025]